MWVPPFGDLRIKAYVPLPAAYRSLSRPSSAPDAKAFPLRSFSLDLLSRIIGLHKKSQRLSLKSQCSGVPSFATSLLAFVSLLLPCSCFLRLRLFIRFSRYAFLFLPEDLGIHALRLNIQTFRHKALFRCGGLKWTRTTDLALIRRAL